MCEIGIDRIQGGAYNTPSREDITVIYDERNTCERLFAFAMAHEMAHMLLYNKQNRAAYYASIIFMENGSTVERRNNLWSNEVEEGMADYLALYIVLKMDYRDHEGQFESYLAQREERYKPIIEIEAKYGKPLMDCTHIDEYSKNGDKKIVIANALWYDAVTRCLNLKLDNKI